MLVAGREYRTIWPAADGTGVEIIDQTRLPHEFVTTRLSDWKDAERAIRHMQVRGAPLIGVTAAYGLFLAAREDPSDEGLRIAAEGLRTARPTAVNLAAAVDDVMVAVEGIEAVDRATHIARLAAEMADEDVRTCHEIGVHGLSLIRDAAERAGSGRAVQILTHCNAGALATVDRGTATSPIYEAHAEGLPVHVWVDETRPRGQGARLTAWELGQHGVPHTVIVDGAAGHLMQRGLVDLCITGTDRTTATGDVCNKIGTYHVALAAADNGVPFYAAVPSTSIDWRMADGVAEIEIEQREADEISWVRGRTRDGRLTSVDILPDGSTAANFAFDVTPARLVTGLITERGVAKATRAGLEALFPEMCDR
jgi:methylthioribose-1-phosphate isomerase